MNYSELLDNVRNYTEVTSDVLSNSVVNVFITNIENQIDRLLDSDSQRRYATSAFIANNSFLDVSGPETSRKELLAIKTEVAYLLCESESRSLSI